MGIEVFDLIKLIKACKASGVSNLKFGDLELKFASGDAEPISTIPSEIVKVPSAEELKEEQELSTLQENADDADEQLAFLAIDDPAEFENLLVQRELTNSGPNGSSSVATSDNFIEAENRRIEQDVQRG